jgi:hypothetical protein
MPNWETFTKRGSTTATEATLTIHKAGALAMSRPAFDFLGGPEWVELLYDPDEKVMGIRGVPEGTPHAYPVRHTETNAGQWLVSGLAFTKYYGIDTSVTRRYRAYVDGDVLCVDLTAPEREIGVSRSSGKGGG